MREELDQVIGWKNEMEKKMIERREELGSVAERVVKEKREQKEE